MSSTCVTDLSPRWIVIFGKGSGDQKESFSLKFNQLDEMLLAISRAKSAGYKTKIMPAK